MPRRSNKGAGSEQLPLELLWGPAPEALESNDEPVRGDGRAPLAPLAAQPGGGAEGPGQLLLGPWPGRGRTHRGPDGGPGGGRPAGRDLHGEGGPAEHGPAAGRGDGPGPDGAAAARAGARGGRRAAVWPIAA